MEMGGEADGGRGLDVDVDVSCEDTGSGGRIKIAR